MVTERPGDGKTFPKKGDMLTMHYHGSLAATGAKFDASYDRGAPFKFQIGVGQVNFPSCLFSLSLSLSPALPLPSFRNERTGTLLQNVERYPFSMSTPLLEDHALRMLRREHLAHVNGTSPEMAGASRR